MWRSFASSPAFVPIMTLIGVVLASLFGWMGARLTGKAQLKSAQTSARAQVGAEADSLVTTAVELSQGVRAELEHAREDLEEERKRFEEERAALRKELRDARVEVEDARTGLAQARQEIHQLREDLTESRAGEIRLTQQLIALQNELERYRDGRGPDARTRVSDPEVEADEDGAV